MAFIQPIEKQTVRRYKVHYTDPLTGKRRSRVFVRAKDAHYFKDNVSKRDYLHNADTVTVATAADKWLVVCEEAGRKGGEPVEKATMRPYRLHARYIKDMIGGVAVHNCETLHCRFKRRPGAAQRRSDSRWGLVAVALDDPSLVWL